MSNDICEGWILSYLRDIAGEYEGSLKNVGLSSEGMKVQLIEVCPPMNFDILFP